MLYRDCGKKMLRKKSFKLIQDAINNIISKHPASTLDHGA